MKQDAPPNLQIWRWLTRLALLQLAAAAGLLVYGIAVPNQGSAAFAGFGLLLLSALGTGGFLPRFLHSDLRQMEADRMQAALYMLAESRHNMMNHVQLVKGYLQLGKYEKLLDPVEKMIGEAQRQSALSNLPGTELGYRLVQRDLQGNMLKFVVELENTAAFSGGEERKLADAILQLADMGEDLCQELGICVEWVVRAAKQRGKLAITLDVLGEDVTDTYMEGLTEELIDSGWVVQTGNEQNAYRLLLEVR
ncbi:Spo0B domain-containing protein [Effusibacillus dendaii]|uniref:SpoOB alpha-helical domain-containing protein n=1 Tax=Effusibacillus dendaii TaxID=2743772 RepID=A0A7I8DAZ4_9BACL|nr:Spo0B domain-containing protein [Effusibacillus dendaii]BCJ86006.1 hypothetical protein skT53_09910 [Effusibacillus dendaii]